MTDRVTRMDPKTAQPTPVTAVPDTAKKQDDVPASGKQQPISIPGPGGKEVEFGVGLGNFEIPELTEIGKDIELPKDVEKAGVKVTPTQVSIPPSLQTYGVIPVGQISQTRSGTGQALPVSDDKIALGLTQGTASSLRWLAEWCIRKLKQAHISVKKVGGKLVRITK